MEYTELTIQRLDAKGREQHSERLDLKREREFAGQDFGEP